MAENERLVRNVTASFAVKDYTVGMKTKQELETEKIENVVLPIALVIAVGLCYVAIRFVRWAWETSVF